MTYRVLKDYEPHEIKKGEIVGISTKEPKFAKKLIKEGIIEALTAEEARVAFDELNGKEE